MAQDFWASSGFRALDREAQGLVPTLDWFGGFLKREELVPPEEAGPREQAMHARLVANPLARVAPETLASIEDADARDNWGAFLRFRDRVLEFPTLEACYRDLFGRQAVDLAPVFVDAMAQAILRAALDGTEDPWLCRAGEMLFRRQRVSSHDGQLLSADAATIEVFAETGGFGNVGRLLRQQQTEIPAVKMDVLSHENAPLYFLRDELFSFVLDITPGRKGAQALAQVLERWVGHLAGVAVTISPVERIHDERWRWHVGLDVDSSAVLNALYRGEEVAPQELERLLLLFRMEFRDPNDALPEMQGRPVYLGLGCRPDRGLKLKPQNLIINLPLRPAQ